MYNMKFREMIFEAEVANVLCKTQQVLPVRCDVNDLLRMRLEIAAAPIAPFLVPFGHVVSCQHRFSPLGSRKVTR